MFISWHPSIPPVTPGGGGASGFTAGSVIFADSTGGFNEDNANLFWDDGNNRLGIGTAASPSTTLHVAGAAALVTYGQAVATSGSPTLLTVTGAAHTTLAASTEAIDLNYNLARTVQFAQGALTTQRAVVFQAPTYAFATGASTLTTAVTVDITGAPSVGANATFTNTYALRVGGATTLASVAGLTYAAINVPAHTVTLTGTTNVTGAVSIAGVTIGAVTITDSSAVTVTGAASLYIVGPPVAAGSVTLSNPYVISAAPDTDATFVFGRSAISSPASDVFYLAHFDNRGSTSAFAIRQGSTGQTSVNSANGQNLVLSINNGTKVTITSIDSLSASVTINGGNSYLDLSGITAGNPNLIITATSDVPAVTWAGGGNAPNAAPAGYIEITVGAASRYIPFWA